MEHNTKLCTACAGTGIEFEARDIVPSMVIPETKSTECKLCGGTGKPSNSD